MPKKNEAPASFEKALSELEQIVTRLESGDLPLEEALNEFERGVQLARQGQAKLQQAEQEHRGLRDLYPQLGTEKRLQRLYGR